MLDLSRIDSAFVFGKNLSILRGPKNIEATPGYISPLSVATAIAMAKIVQSGFEGPIGFLTGQTAGDHLPSEARVIQKAFLSRFETKPSNPLLLLGEGMDTADDVRVALDFARAMGYKSPGFVSIGPHFLTIRKYLSKNDPVTFIPSEEYLTEKDWELVYKDSKVPLEILIESLVGRFVPKNIRRLAAWMQRPGMRK